MTAYSFLDRLLHRAALQVGPIAELSFDLDQRVAAKAGADDGLERPVFVCGLARAGTTILMRRFYATGAFCSLTYRNMPFILAPNLWVRLTKGSQRKMAATERAHGDRILVDFDSPESLDEVFWRIFAGDDYIARDHLRVHTADADTRAKYTAYIRAILHADADRGRRYLSKNNNNILRLTSIAAAFPSATILIPFREPMAHAGSLLRQHRNFAEQQSSDRFVRAYMRWLAHHEFGDDHRPFRFDDEGARRLQALRPDQLDYWLELWLQTYAWLEQTAPSNACFVSYEDLCSDPEVWHRLATLAEVAAREAADEPFVASRSRLDEAADPHRRATATATATELHDRLVARARAILATPQPA